MILVAMVVALVGCNALIPDRLGYGIVFDVPSTGADTHLGTVEWVAENIDYSINNGVYSPHYWQNPEETYTIGSGDCEDLAIIALYLAYLDHGVKGFLIAGYFREDPMFGHAWVEIDGAWYDPMTGCEVDRGWADEVYYFYDRMSYGDVMFRATYLHRAANE